MRMQKRLVQRVNALLTRWNGKVVTLTILLSREARGVRGVVVATSNADSAYNAVKLTAFFVSKPRSSIHKSAELNCGSTEGT